MSFKVLFTILFISVFLFLVDADHFTHSNSQCAISGSNTPTKPCFRLIDIGKFTCDFLYRCCWNPVENRCIQNQGFNQSLTHKLNHEQDNSIGKEPESAPRNGEYGNTIEVTDKSKEDDAHTNPENQNADTYIQSNFGEEYFDGSGEILGSEVDIPLLHENEDLELRSLVIDETSNFHKHLYEADFYEDFPEEYGSGMPQVTESVEKTTDFHKSKSEISQSDEEVIDADVLSATFPPDADIEQNKTNKERKRANRQKRREQKQREREERRLKQLKKRGLTTNDRT